MLTLQNVVVRYGGIEALHGVSIEVPQSRAVAVIGANGAGKTTLAKSVMGLVRLTSGRVIFQGSDLGRLQTEARVRLGIGLVPEGRGLLPTLTVEENLLVGGHTQKTEIRSQLAHIYEEFPMLLPLRRRAARLLSGGELQMLAIGRALMARPRLLILDEPSMGLSPKAAGNVLEALQHLKHAGTTILLVEQNTNLAFEIADYVYVLETGNNVAEGTGEALTDSEFVRESYLGGV